jgi:hypothetical protein
LIFFFLFILSSTTKKGQAGIRSRFATLTILVPPEQPKINQGDFMVTTEDREIELECISIGGKPAAEVSINWNQKKNFTFQIIKRKKSFTFPFYL